jgi:hypothetical protein
MKNYSMTAITPNNRSPSSSRLTAAPQQTQKS